ncbi:acyl transferase domain-containing protein/NAD(P)H-dependent flavin oxidoreductase YrpB (nitropropane dioxygenase family) [Kitasatospora sp. MAP12-15]|uniref:type I polyketide synthase n=1 Tax=unclassified Kitasatospora TaxID=2633591 RepID=UPI00247630A9|nr:type I polyketide synthase [Kitasatospora sp. MAP12-44]MDH6115074.1 acyl transferase domain-containing protein/NAD(P)H-dependent flavin oxidoreductase YrpB (nitropropane dioxygenase family) [Kitasatospora sp. MAP12-44]
MRPVLSLTSPLTDLVIGITPLQQPDAALAEAVCRAGALGVLDLGVGDRRSREELAVLRERLGGGYGVRVGPDCLLSPADLPAPDGVRPAVLLLDGQVPGWEVAQLAAEYRVLVEVTCLEQALTAAQAGAHGLIARGAESGGRVGELSTFVLLQQLLGAPAIDLPVWACGGIGPRTAAAALAGGAAGVVLDSQLALLAESAAPQEAAAALRGMDGSETTVVDGCRVLERRARGGESLKLMVGQDGFLAARFADRWGTVGHAVRGVREAVLDVLDGLRAPAGPGAAARLVGRGTLMSQALGTELPVAQGPMTRVSDQPGFAGAVAAAGALPFVALALAGPEQTRELLARTADAMGGLPWGVGVLGFAAEEVRAAQLEQVLAARPSHAVIAGGRPSQARVLEEAGIRTFLHVPSPGLLRQFLEDGARRFVFEGAECGGHVGPRHSFPLWEAQLAVLEEFLDAAKEPWQPGAPAVVEVLFAGGVHDERSAAMVAALAAPPAARGMAVGLLMGTAYLFTEEAVAHGAVQEQFRRQVLAADGTRLLQTAPGHATRCVPSPFTVEFEQTRERLRAEGVPDREAWEQLERLNVGRLRIASKGVDRLAGELTAVDEQGQLERGMFMAGQVVVLRSATTTLAELHAAVSGGATDFLTARAAELAQRLGLAPAAAPQPEPAPLEIAVIGMAGMFPQAPDLPAFWANVVGGVDAVTEVPPERWDPELYHASDGAAGTTPSKWGGFLPPIPFDALSYGIPPTALASIEPVQLLALEAARRALQDAGYDAGGAQGGRSFDRSRTSVVFGAEAGSDLSNAGVLGAVLPGYLGAVPPAIAEQLPKLTEDSFPGMLANVIAGRIANRLDLGGANFTVDAACASSLAALDVACKELATGSSDLALCGGADLHNGINDFLLFASVHALSPTGRSRPFDASADGIALGEGVGCLVLKRLADAERDGDRVYAVVQGIGSASDGRSLGLTAPRPEGQRLALERAYRGAGLTPAQVGLLEAHGTGTVVGDRTELATLEAVFTESGAAPGSCALGSVKSQIGHTKCAAGLAGLIKASLALHTGIKPPTLHLEQPNAAWQPGASPFAFHAEARPWVEPSAERVAGVSAFGFGGTNFHAVLRGYQGPAPVHGLQQWPAELFTFRGADRERALRGAAELLRLARAEGAPWRLRDLALAASRRAESGHGPVQLALVATDLAELTVLLERAVAGEQSPGLHLAAEDGDAAAGAVAFLFPGQGSQRPGMFAELFAAFPGLQRHLRLGRAQAEVLYPPLAFTPEDRQAQRAAVTDTRVAQPVLGMTGLAAYELLALAGVRPELAGGHSYGELVALCAAGALAAEDLPQLGAERARAILDAVGEGGDPGAMAAVDTGASEVEQLLAAAGLAGRVVAANRNAPRQTVVSGPTAEVEQATALLREAGHGVKRLPVACAFHSPLVAGAGERFAAALAARTVRAPEFPVYSNRTAAAYPPDPAAVRAGLEAQIGAPVRFVEQIEAMYEAGARVFVEAGPGSVLSRLVSAVLADRPHRAVPLEGRRRALPGFLDALAELAVAGVPVRTDRLFRGRDAVDAGRARAARRPGWTVDGQLVRTAAGELLPGALAPVRPVPEALMTAQTPQPNSDALVSEFLRSSRELIAAQRDVLMTYFGATGQPAAALPVPVVAPFALPQPPVEAVTVEEPMAEAAPGAPSLTADDLLRAVVEVIGERTGYPVDMIEPDLDLEADLSIDSIKRTEIIGQLARRLAAAPELGALADEQVEELSRARTAAAITAWLTERLSAPAVQLEAAEPAPQEPQTVQSHDPVRLEFTAAPLAEPDRAAGELAGRRYALLGEDGHGVAQALSGRLAALGGQLLALDATYELLPTDGPLDGVLLLDPLAEHGAPVLPGCVPALQAALARSPRHLLAVRALSSPEAGRADGLRGLFRTLAREYPQLCARLVEVDPADPEQAADALLGELLAEDHEPVVRRTPAGRQGLTLVERGLGALGSTGAGPAGDGVAEASALGLDQDAVVLLVGGARGITARFAATLAAASRCRLELLGRTAWPQDPESAVTAAARDRSALRSALARDGVPLPSVDGAVSRLLAGREVAATLDELARLGSPARYRSVDAADPAALRQAVKEAYAEYGRLDGVVYAAGVIEDKVLAQKDPESFRRVFATKAEGARALLESLAELPAGPRFTVLFGSIAAALGNRGQSDYAAANDALEELGARWADRTGRRALTVHWGPWAPSGAHGGMVSEELARDYTRRGVRLIEPGAGTLALLRELAWGDESVRAVVYTASGW